MTHRPRPFCRFSLRRQYRLDATKPFQVAFGGCIRSGMSRRRIRPIPCAGFMSIATWIIHNSTWSNNGPFSQRLSRRLELEAPSRSMSKELTQLHSSIRTLQESIREIKEAQLNGGRVTAAKNGKPAKWVELINEAGASRAWYQHCHKWML